MAGGVDRLSDWEADQGRLVLKRARLWRANLRGAWLRATKLERAILFGTNLQAARYEPKLGALPDIIALRSASNLEPMRFTDSPHELEELRQTMKVFNSNDKAGP